MLLLLCILCRLPEKEIRRDGRAQNGDECEQIVVRVLNPWMDRPAEDFQPVRLGDECGQDIREKHKRSHLKMRVMYSYDAKINSARMAMVNAGTNHMDGIPLSIDAAAAMPPRSAAMLMVLATKSRRHANHNSQRE